MREFLAEALPDLGRAMITRRTLSVPAAGRLDVPYFDMRGAATGRSSP